MKLLNTLNRRFGRFAIPNLTLILSFSQMFTYGLKYARPEMLERITFLPQKVLEGEWWRLLTFFADPPNTSPISRSTNCNSTPSTPSPIPNTNPSGKTEAR
jgi:hypothetical protein